MSFIKLKIILLISVTFLSIVPSLGNAQGTSAEFIAEVKPAKLKSGEQARDGIKNVFFDNQKLYVTNIWSGLQILDVSNVNKPKEIGVYSTENRSQNCYVVGNTAYLSSELLGVTILDVSNPSGIKEIGRIKTLGDANYVVVNGYFAYVAEETKGINIYDIGNPATPMHKGGYDTPGWAWGLFLDGKTLYVADKSGGIIILDVSNPASPKKLGQYSDMRYAKTIQVEDNIAYVSNGADGLWIFDVINPAFPKLLSKINVDGYVYHTFKAGNSAFLANETRKRMDIVNISNPSKPVKEGEYELDSKVYASWKNNVNVFIAADQKTIIVRHNHPPIITQLADAAVYENELMMFSAEGFDSDGDDIFFTIENKPETASFDSASGIFSWTPTYDESGIYPKVKVSVIENTESKLSQSTTFNITVNHVNRAPSLPDIADSSVAENSKISFTILEGSDPDVEDKGKLKYRAENLPEGASFSEKFRLFTWTPTFVQSGIYTIDFIIEDPEGLLMRDGASITVSHVDRKPTLVEVEDKSINENELLSFTLEGSDPDQEDQGLLSYSAENLPQGASFDANKATFNWTPTFDQSGKYNNVLFIYKAGNLSDSTNVNLTVNHVNRVPTINIIAEQSITENDTLKFIVSGSDPDIEDEGKLTYTAANLPQGASFNGALKSFSWVPTYEQSGSFKDVAFTINDPAGLNDTKSTTITVNHVNRTPELKDITAKVIDENLLLTFDLIGSDADAEDQSKLVYSAKGLPEGAKLNGTNFSWTPSFDQSGNYSIDFTISDGRLSQSKNASVVVNHVNRKPLLVDIPEQPVNENATLSFTVKGSDPDIEDAGNFILSAKDTPLGATFDATTGVFNWIPTFEQSGEYNVTFVNTDPQGLTDEKNVKILANHVNRIPEFQVQDNQVTDENMALTFNLKPATDPDVEDTDKLQYSAIDVPDGAIFDGAMKSFSWTPTFDQSGTYTVKFTVKDSEFAVDQNVIITVNHVNRVPVIEALTTQSINENAELSVKINASDPDTEDAGKVTVTVENLPEGASFNPATTTVTWVPSYKQAGSYPGIAVTALDAGGLNAKAVFDIIVNNVNLAPEITAIAAQMVEENTLMSVTLSAIDSDVEDEGKLVLSTTNLPQGALFDALTGVVSWTPGFDQSGSYTAKAIVTDAEGLTAQTDIQISVTNVNRTPEIKEITTQTGAENTTLTVEVDVSDPDKEDQGNLKIAAQNLPLGATLNESSKRIEWTPDFDQSGNYTINVSVTDIEGLNAQTTFDIAINHVNRAPLISSISGQSVDENKNISVTVGATDPDQEDGNNVSISIDNLPDGASFDASSKTLTWTPTFLQKGSYNVNVTATDPGGLSSEASFSILVNNVNRNPEISGPTSGEVEAGSELILSYSSSDPDEDDILNYSVVSAPAGVNINSEGKLTWTPNDSQAGLSTFSVKVFDGAAEASISLSVTVTAKQLPVPPPPANNDGN